MSKKTHRNITKEKPGPASANPPGSSSWSTHWDKWLLLIILIVTAGIRWRLLDIPLERDEGEYAYAGQLLLDGLAPYKYLYHMKLPGTYVIYALFITVFGESHFGIHLGLLITNLLTIVILFQLAKLLLGAIGGLVTAFSYAILSMNKDVFGLAANCEHFVVLFASAGFLILIIGLRSNKYWHYYIAGLLMGIGFLMKQHGIMFIFGGAVLLIAEKWRLRSSFKEVARAIILYTIGVTGPYLILLVGIIAIGAFDHFWFWTFTYAKKLSSYTNWSGGWLNLKINGGEIVNSSKFIAGLSIIGFSALFWSKKIRDLKSVVIPFTLFSFAATCPALFFRHHYFILFLPAAALLTGIAAQAMVESWFKDFSIRLRSQVVMIMVTSGQLTSLFYHRDYLFHSTPIQACRITYGLNPFPEAAEIGNYIKERTEADDHILVFGSEPQIYFYSQRRAATGHIYTYALMEGGKHALKMQQEFIAEVEANHPTYVVSIRIPTSWLRHKKSHKDLFFWYGKYMRKNQFQKEMVVEINHKGTRYLTGNDMKTKLHSNLIIEVFRRGKTIPPEVIAPRFDAD